MTLEDAKTIGTLLVAGFLAATLLRILCWWALDSKEWFRARRLKKAQKFEAQRRIYERLD